jgi:hypothetical protein
MQLSFRGYAKGRIVTNAPAHATSQLSPPQPHGCTPDIEGGAADGCSWAEPACDVGESDRRSGKRAPVNDAARDHHDHHPTSLAVVRADADRDLYRCTARDQRSALLA